MIENYLLIWFETLLRHHRNFNVFVTSVMKNTAWVYEGWKLHSLSFYISFLLLAQCHLKM